MCTTCLIAYAITSPQYFWDVITYNIYACRWKYTTSSMSFWPSDSRLLMKVFLCDSLLFESGIIEYWIFVQKLTHWGRVTHICVSKLTIIGSDNGLSPDRRQAIIWTNAGLLLIGPLGTSFTEILIEILTFSSKKMRLKVSSAKRRPFCLGLNVFKCLSFPRALCLGTHG